MNLVKLVRLTGKVEDFLDEVDPVDIPSDIGIFAVHDIKGHHFFARWNHEIFLEVTPQAYAVLEQHVLISLAVADAKAKAKDVNEPKAASSSSSE
jgi:hypothetical protein